MTELIPAERWASIPGYEGYFEASDLGRVRSIDRVVTWKNGRKMRYRGRMLEPEFSNSGYLYVRLHAFGTTKGMFVHTLVLLAFVGPRPPGMECCHGPGGKLDNRPENLRWGTHSENNRDKTLHGTDHKRNRKRCPLGHLLIVPNLVPSSAKKGYRSCWACSRAHDYGRYCKIYSHPFDLKTEADEYYRRIMAGDSGNRHKTCRHGHLLEPPNIPAAMAARGQLGCLACKRAENNRQDARRAGRPFDFQAVADQHYARIMAGVNEPLTGASRQGCRDTARR